ncbi:MAG TPA: hypothetical protein VMJ93_06615 [Verrucomicrobiae bacterium]|nr:hypothetical protein [Verrucomicrobiae bacterium]
MATNIAINTILGAVLVFVLSSIWHVATPLGEVGVRNLPHETILSLALKTGISDPGFYFFPGINQSKELSKEQQQAEQARYLKAYEQGPTGILIYSPGGVEFNFGKLLVNQFLLGLALAFLIAWVLAATAAGTTYGQRVLLVGGISAFGALLVPLQYWNWYEFPADYTIAYAAGLFICWGLTGVVMAWIAGKQTKGARA